MDKKCNLCSSVKQLEDFVKSKQYEDGRKPVCKECHNFMGRQRYHRDWVKQQERRRVKHLKLKNAAIDNYGVVCQCCGESERAFLTIDHINNDGAEHRRNTNVGGGHNLYQWLKNNDYPEGFQVLCMNCNFSKHTNGGICIHQEKTYVEN